MKKPFPSTDPKTRELFQKALSKADPLAGQLFGLAIGEPEGPRRRMLESLAIIIAGGSVDLFHEHAAPAFLVALLAAKEPAGFCDCPVCRSGNEGEEHFAA